MSVGKMAQLRLTRFSQEARPTGTRIFILAGERSPSSVNAIAIGNVWGADMSVGKMAQLRLTRFSVKMDITAHFRAA